MRNGKYAQTGPLFTTEQIPQCLHCVLCAERESVGVTKHSGFHNAILKFEVWAKGVGIRQDIIYMSRKRWF